MRRPILPSALVAGLAVLVLAACGTNGVPRLGAVEAHDHVVSGKALLICAYDSEEKCRERHLEGAISLARFREQAAALPRDQELVFYCS